MNEAFQRLAELQVCDEELWAREQEHGAAARPPHGIAGRTRGAGGGVGGVARGPRAGRSRAAPGRDRAAGPGDAAQAPRGPAVPGQDERRLHRPPARDRARTAGHLGVRDEAARGDGRDRVGARRRRCRPRAAGARPPGESRPRARRSTRAKRSSARIWRACARRRRAWSRTSEAKLIEQYERIATRRRPGAPGSRQPVPWLPGRHPAAALIEIQRGERVVTCGNCQRILLRARERASVREASSKNRVKTAVCSGSCEARPTGSERRRAYKNIVFPRSCTIAPTERIAEAARPALLCCLAIFSPRNPSERRSETRNEEQ